MSRTPSTARMLSIADALRVATLCVMALALPAATASAQTDDSRVNLTTFAGVALAPGAHPVAGVAVGLKPPSPVSPRPTPVSLEFEYALSRSDPAGGVPSIVTVSGNLLVQPSRQPSRLRIYGTVGGGLYVQLLNDRSSEANDAWNIGGGAKVALLGPLKFRMDYRAFFLGRINGEYHSNEHRFSVGMVLGF